MCHRSPAALINVSRRQKLESKARTTKPGIGLLSWSIIVPRVSTLSAITSSLIH